MITLKYTNDGSHLQCASKGVAVYLDTFAFIELALHKPELRRRFIAAIRREADVIFSVTNIAELALLQGNSLHAVRCFMAEIGNDWLPAELNVFEIIEREKAGGGQQSFVSERFLRDYFAYRVSQAGQLSPCVLAIPGDEALSLEGFLDWITPQRDSLLKSKADMDDVLQKTVFGLRRQYDADPSWLDRTYPLLPFDGRFRGHFVASRLLRGLIEEAKERPLKKGDGLDFFHAVVAAGFCSGGTLDKHWKRRVNMIAGPHQLTPVYSRNELDEFVEGMEIAVAQVEKIKQPSLIWIP
jgi:hypothetical protein